LAKTTCSCSTGTNTDSWRSNYVANKPTSKDMLGQTTSLHTDGHI